MLTKLTERLGPLKLLKETAEMYRQQFEDLRPWWPLLIPFLLWSARKAYQKEYIETLATPGKPVVERG
ncbi:MAG TPA: hypothetical protein VGE07_05190 [Herpetosiphonaceae bacterium]